MLPSMPMAISFIKPLSSITLYCNVSGSITINVRDNVVYSIPSGLQAIRYGFHLLVLYKLGRIILLFTISFVATSIAKIVPSTAPQRCPSGPKESSPIIRGASSIPGMSGVNSSIFLPFLTSHMNIFAADSTGSLPKPPQTEVPPYR
ncbi:hypothetical protein D3C77_451180 [compost metagenome]